MMDGLMKYQSTQVFLGLWTTHLCHKSLSHLWLLNWRITTQFPLGFVILPLLSSAQAPCEFVTFKLGHFPFNTKIVIICHTLNVIMLMILKSVPRNCCDQKNKRNFDFEACRNIFFKMIIAPTRKKLMQA